METKGQSPAVDVKERFALQSAPAGDVPVGCHEAT